LIGRAVGRGWYAHIVVNQFFNGNEGRDTRAPRPQRYFDQSLLSSRFLDETWYQRWRSLREAWPRTLRRRRHETGPRNEGRQLVVILGLANSSSSRHSLEEKSYLLFLELLLFLGLALFR
jgi:hypothetical protein